MDYLTAAQKVSAELATLTDVRDPAVRSALDLAVRPWLDGRHTGAEAMRWGTFATAVQAVIASSWSGPSRVRVEAEPAVPGPALTAAVARLADAAAGVFGRSANDPTDPLAWQHAAGAAQIREAITELLQSTAGPWA